MRVIFQGRVKQTQRELSVRTRTAMRGAAINDSPLDMHGHKLRNLSAKVGAVLLTSKTVLHGLAQSRKPPYDMAIIADPRNRFESSNSRPKLSKPNTHSNIFLT